MPRYEYQCQNCGAGVELSRSIAERNDYVACTECEVEGSMELVPSLTSFSLKGGGWTPKGSATPAPPRKAKRGTGAGYDMTGDRHR